MPIFLEVTLEADWGDFHILDTPVPNPDSSSGILPNHIRLDNWGNQRLCNPNCSRDNKLPNPRRKVAIMTLCPIMKIRFK